jgi:hypothetical protein
VKNKAGNSALHECGIRGNKEMGDYLRNSGAFDEKDENSQGLTYKQILEESELTLMYLDLKLLHENSH